MTSLHHLPQTLQDGIAEAVRQAMWRCLVRGLLVFGLDTHNPNFPWYQVTAQGAKALDAKAPQPYDPDGFIDYFKRMNPSADPVVLDYLEEAVSTFQAGSMKASAVMLGAASEKMILLVIDQLGAAISDPTKQAQYQKDVEKNWTVSHKWGVLRSTLERVMNAKLTPFPREVAETMRTDLPMVFELLRRVRNVAGHPEVPGRVDTDGVFMNLRVFPEYARRVSELLSHLATNKVDW
jgi:hypothetical protein